MHKILIVGLGNPNYKGTRHNIGADFVQYIQNNYSNNPNLLFFSEISLMNISGLYIKKILTKTKSKLLILIMDDIDLKFGCVKISYGVKARGHNGIRSTIEHLGHTQFYQIRMGIGKQEPISDFVLEKFNKEEYLEMNNFFEKTKLEFLKLLIKIHEETLNVLK